METEEDEEDLSEEDEEEFSDEEETDGSRTAYKKNRWRVVAIWTNTTKKEAYKAAAEIITAESRVVRRIHGGNQRIRRYGLAVLEA